MRKCLSILMIMLLMSAANAWAEDLKIGIINLDRLLTESSPGKEAQERLQAKAKASKAELEKLKADMQKLQEELEKQSVALSQESKQEKALEFRTKYTEYYGKVQESQMALAEEQKKALQPIIEVLMTVVIDYGKSEDYTLILDTKNGGVAYADEAINITDTILDLFETAWKNR